MDVETGNGGPSPTAMRHASDPGAQFSLLQRIHEATLSGTSPPAAPRSVISESWRRSLAAQVDPDEYRPLLIYPADEIADVRSAHPLRSVLEPLRGLLGGVVDDDQHVVIVTDADGTILWRDGSRELCRKADPVGLCEGTRWAEESIGTNAMGTALAVDAPVQIYSAEHLVRTYHTWTCAAAPIHDPDSGTVLGVLDISGLLTSLHPAVVALVGAAAQLTENRLRLQMEERDQRMRERNLPHLLGLGGDAGALLTPTGRVIAGESSVAWPGRVAIAPGAERVVLDDGREAKVEPLADGYLLRVGDRRSATPRAPTLSLSFLADKPAAVVDGRPLALTLRRAEILAVLALHPAGLTAEQLALHLYGDSGNPTTARAEVHRLRAQLGTHAMSAKPYRLTADVQADFRTVADALRSGDVPAAAAMWRGPLLPRSDAPTIRAERDQLVTSMRTAVLRRPDPEPLWTFAQYEPGSDDVEVHERLRQLLPDGDPRAELVNTRLCRLRHVDL